MSQNEVSRNLEMKPLLWEDILRFCDIGLPSIFLFEMIKMDPMRVFLVSSKGSFSYTALAISHSQDKQPLGSLSN